MSSRFSLKQGALILTILAAMGLCGLTVATYLSLEPTPDDFSLLAEQVKRNTYVDRSGNRLNVTYENDWNVNDRAGLHEVPVLLRDAFILSEDKRFFKHDGVDWLARLNALTQNLKAGEAVRGASTITEQVVRMINKRPRNIWSRWLEGFEAMALERQHHKVEILEFYLNQVPYKSRRRGVVQAAHLYFDRDLVTLNSIEMLSLVVLVRSPQRYDPHSQKRRLLKSVENLAERMEKENLLSKDMTMSQPLSLRASDASYNARHFLEFANAQSESSPTNGSRVHTTLDVELQAKIQNILDDRLERLQPAHVQNGAVLVVDHEANEIRSWVVGYAGRKERPYNQVNAVLVRRQPGSALKPLLYTKALLKGWTAATMLDDRPLEQSVGLGLHSFQNYSYAHYGRISVREALGNSLNIPAVRTIQFVGPEQFLNFLHDLGIHSLKDHPDVYGVGLALGNGELTLYELVQAYTVLARMGDYKPVTLFEGASERIGSHRVFSEDVASLVADIMSDSTAREKEFGRGSILNFPGQTAVKTGTSSDYRDAWAIGFNDKYTVGVWLGNLDYSSMHEITGSSGPAIVLRTIFNELNKNRQVRALYFSDKLVKHSVCIETGLIARGKCAKRDEWFVPGNDIEEEFTDLPYKPGLIKPTKGLLMAMDPRIPDEHEYFEFAVSKTTGIQQVKWYVNDTLVGITQAPFFHWKLVKGEFKAYAEILMEQEDEPIITNAAGYQVF